MIPPATELAYGLAVFAAARAIGHPALRAKRALDGLGLDAKLRRDEPLTLDDLEQLRGWCDMAEVDGQ